MTLSKLLCGILPVKDRFAEQEISTLTERSDKALDNSLMVCIQGARFDGHDHAADAYARGCRFFVAQKPLSLPDDACVLLVEDTRATLARLACRFYEAPSHDLCVVAITGTKGKTTTAQLLSGILNRAGIACGYIGTNGISYGDFFAESKNTTPDALTLQGTLASMRHAGMQAVVLEVSSQALWQFRADGTRIHCAIFTNLSPDHIGTNEHPTQEHYAQCKLRLFSEFSPTTVICNADDSFAECVLQDAKAERLVTCSTQGLDADWTASDIRATHAQDHLGVSFSFGNGSCQEQTTLSLTGAVNACNALLATAAAVECFDISPAFCARTLPSITVSGRSEILRLPNGAYAVIDYAHNGASLTQLLKTLRAYRPTRLICLFGSVGGRAQIRRRELAAAAASYSDLSVLTSDNPAHEDPEEILDDIAAYYEEQSKPYLRICDRADAIRQAVALTKFGDILVLAGKGHENYQLIGERRLPFCEREIVKEACLSMTGV